MQLSACVASLSLEDSVAADRLVLSRAVGQRFRDFENWRPVRGESKESWIAASPGCGSVAFACPSRSLSTRGQGNVAEGEGAGVSVRLKGRGSSLCGECASWGRSFRFRAVAMFEASAVRRFLIGTRSDRARPEMGRCGRPPARSGPASWNPR